MDLTGSAQRLMETLKRWTSSDSYADVIGELEEMAEEPQRFDGQAVEGALGRVARQSGWWERILHGFIPTMDWRDPKEEGGVKVVPLGPLEGFTLESDAD